MANIASVLKAEIARIARKEIRAEVDGLKKAVTQQRGVIVQLRRQVAELQKQLKRADRHAAAASARSSQAQEEVPRRFSAARLASHRAKIGLSAAAYGKLVGMSGATIYLWEQGRSRPNAEQLARLATVRSLSRRRALEQAAED